jgi:phage gp46-like protein
MTSSSASFLLPVSDSGATPPVLVQGATVGRNAEPSKPISDVHLRHTADGGEIDFVNGDAVLSDGLESAAYLSMFGGNERDSGLRGDDLLQWWGNLDETEPARKYRSETQHLLHSLPAIPANLRRVEDAAKHDLAWFVDTGIARSIEATASIPGINRVSLDISVELASRELRRFQIPVPWGDPK